MASRLRDIMGIPRHFSNQCIYCGSCSRTEFDSNGKPVCQAATCLACGSTTCTRGRCPICFVGLMPGWSGNTCQCARKGCTAGAVAEVRKRKVCLEHAGDAIKPQPKLSWRDYREVDEGEYSAAAYVPTRA